MKKFFLSILSSLRSKVSRLILYALGISAVSFVFEACYGTPQVSELNKNFKLKGKLLTQDGKAASNVGLIATSSSDVEKITTMGDGSFSLDINARYLETVNIKVVNGSGETFVVMPATNQEVNVELENTEK